MSKQVITLNSFEKGIDSASDPRDLAQGYVADCVNLMVDERGKIRTMGAITNHYAQGDTNQPTITIPAGRGLFAFSHDRLEGEQASTTDGVPSGTASDETSDDYLAVATAGANPLVYINSLQTGAFGVKASIDLGATTGMKPTFHTFDGGLRVSDGNFGAANRTKWFGYIDRKKFHGSAGVGYDDDGWYSLNNDLAQPPAGTFAEDTTFANTDSGDAGKVNVSMITNDDSDKPESEWQKEWQCGVTYVYDGTQETLVTTLTGTVDESANTALSTCRFQLQIFGASDDKINQRLTHVKIYIREVGTQEWFIQGVFDLELGGRLINGDDYVVWSALTGGAGDDSFTSYNDANAQPIPQILHTWESETGVFNDEKSLDIGQLGDGYGASVVIGRTVYVGNVKRKNFNGETIIEADAIYKSIPDQPDTFPASWRIDAAVNDGEGITALHKWGKDLLQFKHRTLYIIDTSGETEILKSTFKKAGARNSAIIAETPHGIVWANEWGLWLYNGELQNLLSQDSLGNRFVTQGGMPKTLSFEVAGAQGQSAGGGIANLATVEQSTWSTFLNKDSILGYYPYKQQIIILDSCDDSENNCAGNIYIYDFRTGSMVRGTGIFTADQDHTNFVTDSNDDLVIAHTTGTIVKWGDTESAKTGQVIEFPEFGTIGKKMKVYAVSINYKSSETQATPLEFRYVSDGAATTWADWGSVGMSDTGGGTAEDWTRTTFTRTTPLECETIQFRIKLNSTGVIQINDLSITIRTLGAKLSD